MLVAGLMSGTSLDGVDAVLVDITKKDADLKIKFLDKVKIEYPTSLIELIEKLILSEFCIKEFAIAREQVSIISSDAIRLLSEKSKKKITLIGFHGQTIFHRPDKSMTIQLGDSSIIAVHNKARIWSDFRSLDIRLKGEGAPLAPFAHYHLFKKSDENRVILNLGGIANITFIPKRAASFKSVIGFDTGPGMRLIDIVSFKLNIGRFDDLGKNARKGKIDKELLDKLFDDNFFFKKYPKSTGRELFNEQYLKSRSIDLDFPTLDQLATVTELTAKTVKQALLLLPLKGKLDKLIVAGGGAKNLYLLERLKSNLPDEVDIEKTEKYSIPVDALEGMLIALLAYCSESKIRYSFSNLTGSLDMKLIHGSRISGL